MLKTLENCPIVISVTKLELKNELEFITDQEFKIKVQERLDRIEVYRFVYKVHKLQVVGFVSYSKEAHNLPCIITLRGGSRDFGKIETPWLIREHTFFADQGYVVISTQYPGVDGGTGQDNWGGKDDIDSIKALKKILEWIPQADTSLVAVKGHSRGGAMTYMMLREVNWIKTAIIGAGPTDEFKAAKERKGWRDHQISMFGKSRAEVLKRSAIKWVSELPKKTPILIMHGSADWRVSADHSILMSLELFKNKIPHRFVLFEGADHGIWEFKKEYTDHTLQWLKRYLKKDRELPNMKLHGK